MSATLFPLPKRTTPPEWMAIETLRRAAADAEVVAEAADTWSENEGWRLLSTADVDEIDRLYDVAASLDRDLTTRERIVETWLKGWWTNGGL
jgi:hypothetical protein